MELTVDLGPMPYSSLSTGVAQRGLAALRESGELCDLVIRVGGQLFLAHRVVLAAASLKMTEYLKDLETSSQDSGATVPGARLPTVELQLDDVSHPEAVRAMLDSVYGTPAKDYCPSSAEANNDVLRLARRFELPRLQEQATRWLAHGLTTVNVLERLVACDEFGLVEVRSKILEQLTANPEALFVLAQNPRMLKAPAVLQDLLVRVFSLLGCGQGTAAEAEAKVPTAPHAAAAESVQGSTAARTPLTTARCRMAKKAGA